MHFGEHLTIDGYGGKKELLDNKELIFKLLNELPEKLEMKKLAEPRIIPYNPKVKEIVVDIKNKIMEEGINLEVAHMGASALEISGQGDIDLYILCKEEDFDAYAPRLEKLFGRQVSGISIYKWQLNIAGFEIEMYLTNPKTPSMKEQIVVFEKLKNNKELLKEYESIKSSADDLSFKEYMRRKYEFFNKIL